jgi:hypothetical protein
MKIKPFTHLYAFLVITLFLLNSCGALSYKKADVKDYPINDKDKREKNMKEGRKITFGTGKDKQRSGKFDFASSNEMWRATIEVLDFVPLLNADYGGGIIITDWYSENQKKNESIKISVQFLTNEIRSDALEIKIYNKKCSDIQNCVTSRINSELNSEIKLAILKKAALLKKESNTKSAKW